MSDYGEMQKTLRMLNERIGTLAGSPCPNANCFGTLRWFNDELACTACRRDGPHLGSER